MEFVIVAAAPIVAAVASVGKIALAMAPVAAPVGAVLVTK